MKKFIVTLALLVATGFAVSAQSGNHVTSPGLIPGKPCVPSPDYLKMTVRVEIKGTLAYIPPYELERDPRYPMPNLFPGIAQISANGKTYHLNLSGAREQARKLSGQIVIVTGILHGNTVQVADLRLPVLKDARQYVHETTEVEARGQLRAIVVLRQAHRRFPEDLLLRPMAAIVGFNVVVDGKTYNLELTPEQWKLAESFDGKDVILTGVLNKDTITVNAIKVAR